MPKPTPTYGAGRHGFSRPPALALPQQWLFCYGTLMIADIFSLIAGISRPVATPATLVGFERKRLSGKLYPGIRRCNDASVDGVIYAVTKLALPPLDRYEGEMYVRENVTVNTAEGDKNAWTYVLRPRYAFLMQKNDWSIEHFRERQLGEYLTRLREIPRAPR